MTRGGDAIEVVCPACHAGLARQPDGGLRCAACGTAYPRRAGVDVLLTDGEWEALAAELAREEAYLARYRRARRESPLTALYYDHWVARMLAEVPPGCAGPVLELMCGEGEICRRLPPRLQHGLALDLNVALVERAAADLRALFGGRVAAACGTAVRLPVASGSVGLVMIQGGLHHARPQLGAILGEIARVLRPGGVLAASEPADDFWVTRRLRRAVYRRSAMLGHDEGEEGFTCPQLTAALAAAGLRLDRYRRCGFIAYPLLGNTDVLPLLAQSRARRLGELLLAMDRLLEHVPVVRGMGWISIFTASKAVAPAQPPGRSTFPRID